MTAPLALGAVVAEGYTVIAHLARNQATDVYDVLSAERDCRCVAKRVRPDRRDGRARARLIREGEVLLGCTHPHLVRAYELLRAPEPVLILETLSGATLSRLVDDLGPLPGAELAELGLQLCSAVGYLHRRGWLHLDLKPDNVVAENGLAKVLDLSLCRPPGPVPAGVGTRGYRSPEQEAGAEVGPPADVWGIGGVLRVAAGDDAPPHLVALIASCLHEDPAARPTVAALSGALAPDAAPLRDAA